MINARGHESENVRQSKKVSGNTQHFLHNMYSRGNNRKEMYKKVLHVQSCFFFFTFVIVFTDSLVLHDFLFCLSKL